MRRYLLTAAISFTILSALTAALCSWISLAQYDAWLIFAECAICLGVSRAMYLLEAVFEDGWRTYLICTGLGTGAACAVLMPAGLLEANLLSVCVSAGVSAAVCALTSAALLVTDGEEAVQINAEIQNRRRE